ncbi:hypothetical protein DVH24_015334 [Malus domestica]|uniref:Uncharacterized protein n=1 Tax=Malus domestica TaxID=3750 RepID=A0A498K7U7_MALDO|nr:hypothetical protein DVH24_015334 [Malus domestica]
MALPGQSTSFAGPRRFIELIQEDEFLAPEKKEYLISYVREQLLEAREAKNRQRIARDKKIYNLYTLQTPHFPPLTVQRYPYISFYRLDAHEVL